MVAFLSWNFGIGFIFGLLDLVLLVRGRRVLIWSGLVGRVGEGVCGDRGARWRMGD